jgi:ankyrin repeat protein
VETLKALVSAGASLSVTDRKGQTPLALARARRYGDMVSVLQSAGAK